jgi:hypothetical protein
LLREKRCIVCSYDSNYALHCLCLQQKATVWHWHLHPQIATFTLPCHATAFVTNTNEGQQPTRGV